MVEGLEAVASAKLGIFEAVADLDLALHVMDDHVHIGHRPGFRRVFLAVELERRVSFARAEIHFFFEHQLAFDKQSRRAAARVVNGHARLRVENPGHDHADFFWRVKFSGAGDAAFGELADQILIRAADDIRLDIVQAQALFTDSLDQVTQAIVIQIAHAVRRSVEINPVDDPFEEGILISDLAQIGRQLLPELFLVFVVRRALRILTGPDHRPNRALRIFRFQRQEETNQLFVVLDESKGLGARTDLFGNSVQLVVEHIAEPLGEDQRQNILLVLRRIFCPANRTRRIPDPGFQRLIVASVCRHIFGGFYAIGQGDDKDGGTEANAERRARLNLEG